MYAAVQGSGGSAHHGREGSGRILINKEPSPVTTQLTKEAGLATLSRSRLLRGAI